MDRLTALQRAIDGRAASCDDRLGVTMIGGLARLDFYGCPFGDSFADLLAALADAEVAGVIAALDLRGPDDGSNGTRNWDLTPLADSGAAFPTLRRLSIEQAKPADHNQTIVGQSYDEDGVLAKILAKAPALEVLVTPSAPNADFFRAGRRPLELLSVDAGYDHQGFIANLAASACFPSLRSLEFGEYNETYMADFAAHVTPFADYRALFASPAFASVNVFRWRNPTCSPEEMAESRRLNAGRQVHVTHWSSEWLR